MPGFGGTRRSAGGLDVAAVGRACLHARFRRRHGRGRAEHNRPEPRLAPAGCVTERPAGAVPGRSLRLAAAWERGMRHHCRKVGGSVWMPHGTVTADAHTIRFESAPYRTRLADRASPPARTSSTRPRSSLPSPRTSRPPSARAATSVAASTGLTSSIPSPLMTPVVVLRLRLLAQTASAVADLDRRDVEATRELAALVAQTGSTLDRLPGLAPRVAARPGPSGTGGSRRRPRASAA